MNKFYTILKYSFITLWTVFIVAPFLWIFFPEIIWFYFLIILSWKINNNKCLITQLEYYLFEETFLGKKNKFIVPIHHRFILYINTLNNSRYYALFTKIISNLFGFLWTSFMTSKILFEKKFINVLYFLNII